jgi:hypothetical protein
MQGYSQDASRLLQSRQNPQLIRVPRNDRNLCRGATTAQLGYDETHGIAWRTWRRSCPLRKQYRGKSYIGAPRTMKMGNTPSLWHYEAVMRPCAGLRLTSRAISRTGRGIASVEIPGPKRGHRVESHGVESSWFHAPLRSARWDARACVGGLDRLLKRSDIAVERASLSRGCLGSRGRAALDQDECAFAGDRSTGLSVFET